MEVPRVAPVHHLLHARHPGGVDLVGGLVRVDVPRHREAHRVEAGVGDGVDEALGGRRPPGAFAVWRLQGVSEVPSVGGGGQLREGGHREHEQKRDLHDQRGQGSVHVLVFLFRIRCRQPRPRTGPSLPVAPDYWWVNPTRRARGAASGK